MPKTIRRNKSPGRPLTEDEIEAKKAALAASVVAGDESEDDDSGDEIIRATATTAKGKKERKGVSRTGNKIQVTTPASTSTLYIL